MIRATLLSIALAWTQPTPPKGHAQEPRAEYERRVTTVIDAALSVTHNPRELAAIVVVIKHESALDPWVHAGLEHPNPFLSQDRGRARCLLQIHQNQHIGHDGWLALGGTDFDATRRCFAEGLRLLRSAAWMCTHSQMITVDDMARVFSAYAGHSSCIPTAGSVRRAKNWEQIVHRLRGESVAEGGKK